MMMLLLIHMILSFTNGELIIKRDGMMYQQISSNGSWDIVDSQSQESSENQFIQMVSQTKSNCKCGWSNKRSLTRIVGGDFYKPHKYPFIAGVAMSSGGGWKPFCGGSILTTNHVLTAAHCTNDVIGLRTQLAVLLGTYDMTKPDPSAEAIPVGSVVQHQEFNCKNLLNDIALLVLSKSITFNTNIGPVCMPQPGLDITSQTVKILGWGAQKYQGPMTSTPKEMDTKVVPTAQCSALWPGIVPSVRPTQICTFSNDASPCGGDSGGPVVWLDPSSSQYTLVGIVSFGDHCTELKPSVQTKVVSYIPWIQQQIRTHTPASIC
uniref:Trypsin n=1 Tax=Lygus lineolaris TaxID=50650 RepID=A0A184WFU2_LYGLI|nr:trypsin precursor [Lygus lineolaris]